MPLRSLTAILAGAAMAVVPAAAQERPRDDPESGAYLYRTFCASCHGADGTGAGPVADLAPARPPDLTTLSRRNGGVFPRARVMAVLEAAEPTAGHRAPAMPDWNAVLLRLADGNQKTVARQRERIVQHLESLQVKPR